MIESFYLSNVVPQNYENNAGFWNRFEMYCRDLTNKFSSVYIISGPLVLPQADESGKKFVKYQVSLNTVFHLISAATTHQNRQNRWLGGASVTELLVPSEHVTLVQCLSNVVQTSRVFGQCWVDIVLIRRQCLNMTDLYSLIHSEC